MRPSNAYSAFFVQNGGIIAPTSKTVRDMREKLENCRTSSFQFKTAHFEQEC